MYIEQGKTRCFAVAVDWPGWARIGAGEEEALDALARYVKRYREAIAAARRDLPASLQPDQLRVVERLAGGSGTDFGAIGAIPPSDGLPLGGPELRRQLGMLTASWKAFERAADAAKGVKLTTGPRGGGRTLAKIRAHVDEADRAYMSKVGGSLPAGARGDTDALRAAFGEAIRERAAGRVPDFGPRGGARWPARYAIRRAAWHALDHAWEIEDRSGRT